MVLAGRVDGASMSRDFYVQHGYGSAGPFRTESVATRELWTRRKPPASGIIVCRFMVRYRGRWRRLYSDRNAKGIPHFIIAQGVRLAITGVSP